MRVPPTILISGNMKGYRVVTLCYGKRETKIVHRLVAEAFLGPCPEGFQVSHLDESRDNNNASNLAYVSAKENMNMPMRCIRASVALKGKNRAVGASNPNAIAVRQLTKEGVFVREFRCISDAVRETGILGSSISNCLKGRSRSAGGYVWVYEARIEKLVMSIK